jgi:hypothetical protein
MQGGGAAVTKPLVCSKKATGGGAVALLLLMALTSWRQKEDQLHHIGEQTGAGTVGGAGPDCSSSTTQSVLQSCGAGAAAAGSAAWIPGPLAERRQRALALDAADLVGAGLVLTAPEREVDGLLRAARGVHLAAVPSLPTVHFFEAKARYEAGAVLPIVRALPKGAAQHVHSDSMVPVDWLVGHATYDPHLYVCGDIDLARDFSFQFSDGSPEDRAVPAACEKSTGWRRVVDLRSRHPGGDGPFDQSLISALTLLHPAGVSPGAPPYGTLDDVWAAFGGALVAADNLIFYEPVHTAYVQHAIDTFMADGIQVWHMRAGRAAALPHHLTPFCTVRRPGPRAAAPAPGPHRANVQPRRHSAPRGPPRREDTEAVGRSCRRRRAAPAVPLAGAHTALSPAMHSPDVPFPAGPH